MTVNGNQIDFVTAADVAGAPQSYAQALVDKTNTFLYMLRANTNGLYIYKYNLVTGLLVGSVLIDSNVSPNVPTGGTFNISGDGTVLVGTYTDGRATFPPPLGTAKIFNVLASSLTLVGTFNLIDTFSLYNSGSLKGRVLTQAGDFGYMIEQHSGVRSLYTTPIAGPNDVKHTIVQNTTTPSETFCIDKFGVLWGFNDSSQHLFTSTVVGTVYSGSTDVLDLSSQGVWAQFTPVVYNNSDHTLSMIFGDSTSPTMFHAIKLDLATLTILETTPTINESAYQSPGAIQNGQWRTDDSLMVIGSSSKKAYMFNTANGTQNTQDFTALGWDFSTPANFNAFVIQAYGIMSQSIPQIWIAGTFVGFNGTLQDAGDVMVAWIAWGQVVKLMQTPIIPIRTPLPRPRPVGIMFLRKDCAPPCKP